MEPPLEPIVEDIQGIETQWRRSEQKHLIPSHVFYQLQVNGKIKHEADFGEWVAYIELRKQREEQYKAFFNRADLT